MNLRLVLYYLGFIYWSLAIAFFACMLVGENYSETTSEEWWAAIIFTFVLGFISNRCGAPKAVMYRREALCIIGLGWVVSCLLGALPYMFVNPDLNIIDCIFESTSGLTTTGASILESPGGLEKSLLFWRAMSQWVGGLGIVVFFVAILSYMGAEARMIYTHESSAQASDLDTSKIQSGLLKIVLIYGLLSVACCGMFYWEGMTFFDAVTHMFATVSTGGFSTHVESMAYFKSDWIEWTTVLFMVLGGTSFVLCMQVVSHGFKIIRSNVEFLAYILIIIVFGLGSTAVVFEGYGMSSFTESLRIAFFQVVSIMTTTGFSTVDYDKSAPVLHVFLMLLMMMGACSGSTAGGMKIIRIVTVGRIMWYHIEKSFRPRLVKSLKIGSKTLKDTVQQSILMFVLLGCVLIFLSLLVVALLEQDVSFEGTFSAVLACMFNIGPGFAEVGPGQNYSGFQEPTKLVLSFLMILGRLEFYALLALFIPSFWRRFS